MGRLNRRFQQAIGIGCVLVLLVIYRNQDATYMDHSKDNTGSKQRIDFNGDRADEVENAEPVITQCEMKDRVVNIREMCERYYGGIHYDAIVNPATSRSERHNYIRNLLVNDEHKLLACFNSKAGSTTFKTVMTRYSKNYTENRKGYDSWDVVHGLDYLKDHNITFLQYLTDDQIIHRLKTYTRVTFVRHPLVRVYSAYKDKLATNKPPECQYYQETMGVRILKKMRLNLTQEELKCAYWVTFPEFVEYYVGPGLFDIMSDVHFDSFSHRCNPCFVNYDFIVKLETSERDQKAFIDQFMNPKPDEERHFHVHEVKNKGYAVDNFQTLVKQYSQVNASHIQRLLNIYQKDMNLFGYSAEIGQDGLKTACKMQNGPDQCC